MRAVTDGKLELNDRVRGHLELCLDCRACETACPSGVQYGKLIEPFRVAMDEASGEPRREDWFHKHILFGLFPYANKMRRALIPARIAQRTGLMKLAQATRLTSLLPSPLRRMVDMLPPPRKNEGALPEFLPAIGRRRATVALFTG
jgi:glycolate oxidase iron-sulfur subunit